MTQLAFEFGVLPEPVTVDATNWIVEPLPDSQATIDAWKATGRDPAWVYPPFQRTISQRYSKRKKAVVACRVPRSVRQADVWPVPPTHRLVYRGPASLRSRLPKPLIVTFIVYLLGTLYGVELQHAGWRVTGRQRKRPFAAFVHLPGSREAMIDLADTWFAGVPRSAQTCITSALYIHNHVPAYQWDWERFAWQYSVFDAAWATACVNGAIPPGPKGRPWPQIRRFGVFARAHRIKRDQRQFSKWVACRNDLIHEVTWGHVIPGQQPRKGVSSYYLPLRAFSTLALLASIGYRGRTLGIRWDTACQPGLFA